MLQDYIRFARAKGLSPSRIVGVHVAEEHHDPGRHRARPRARLDDRLRGRDRDGVRLSGHGQAPDRFDQPPRPSDHRRLPDAHGGDLRRHQPRRRSALRGDRSARAARPRRRADRWPTTRTRRPRVRCAPQRREPVAPVDRGESLLRRHVAAFLAGPGAVLGLAVLVVLRAPRDPRAPRSRRRTPTTCRSSTSWTTCWRPARSSAPASPPGSAPTTRAATCSPPSSTACASRLASARSRSSSPAPSAPRSACSRPMRAAASSRSSCASSTCSSRSPRSSSRSCCSPCSGAASTRSCIALVIVQWAYYARTVRGSALVEKRREYIEAARCLALPKLAHRLPPPPAELPAAAHRRRDRAGGARHRARIDAVVPRRRRAGDRAVARHADRDTATTTCSPANTGSRPSRASRSSSRSSPSTSSATGCATCSTRGSRR